MIWTGTIQGNLVSKANSRQLVNRGRGGRPMFIKSQMARDWIASAGGQIRPPMEPIEDDVALIATVYYSSRRPDLDESLLMDGLQAWGVIKNDRQIREKHIYGDVDRERPRVVVRIEPRQEEGPLYVIPI